MDCADWYEDDYYMQIQHNNATGRREYPNPVQYNQLVYAQQPHLKYYPHYFWYNYPYYVPQYLSPYDNYQGESEELGVWDEWIAISDEILAEEGYQAFDILQTQPHEQDFSQNFPPYSHHTENHTLWRYMTIDEYQNQNNPLVNNGLSYHMEDEVLVLQTFEPPTEFGEWLATHEDSLGYTTYVSDHDRIDELIEAELEKKTYISSSSEEDHDLCVVCLTKYENKEEIGGLRCGHVYHVECIKTWLKRKNECPICRGVALSF